MSWHGWSVQPSLAYVIVAAVLYQVGGRGFRRGAQEPLREAAFGLGLVTIVLALDSPIDGYSEQLFWVHMLQHVLLLTVAPPLILLGRPWPRMWRALPLGMRTSVGRSLARGRWAAPIRSLAHPMPAWLLFNATLLGWHIPAAYDATLTNGVIHDVEHAMFFFTGLLFWARIVDPGPLRPRLTWVARGAYVIGAMVISTALALVLVFDQHPIYTFYAHLAHRPGDLSALSDQQLAGGIMWVLGSVPFGATILVAVYRWLDPDADAHPPRPAVTT